jgi:aminopeptidase N
MLRRRLGDENFLKMLAELRRRSDRQSFSTADLRALVKEFLPQRVPAATVDGFFDNWVYSTGIPALKLTYSVKGLAPAVKISGKIEQSGVDDAFSIDAPIEVQFAKGPAQTIWIETSNAGATFSATLKQPPARVSIPIGTGVLATKK